jgi:hypothetical protein
MEKASCITKQAISTREFLPKARRMAKVCPLFKNKSAKSFGPTENRYFQDKTNIKPLLLYIPNKKIQKDIQKFEIQSLFLL